MTKKNPYPYLVALALVLPLYVWLVAGCPGLTIDKSTHNHIQIERVLVKDTVETKRLKAENKELRRECYQRKKANYRLKTSFDSLGIKSHQKDGILKDRNLFPLIEFDSKGKAKK
jgi:hypothetical protein